MTRLFKDNFVPNGIGFQTYQEKISGAYGESTVTKRTPGPCAYKKLVYPAAERIVISITLGKKVIVLKKIKLSRRAEYNNIIKFEKIIV